jgi:ElaB/YqjD/DUF883 family membrane-anchored ribosome-binding protein
MSSSSERILDDLQKVLVEIEELVDFRKRARAADSYVRDNAWTAVGIAAAAAFLLGLFAARRQ